MVGGKIQGTRRPGSLLREPRRRRRTRRDRWLGPQILPGIARRATADSRPSTEAVLRTRPRTRASPASLPAAAGHAAGDIASALSPLARHVPDGPSRSARSEPIATTNPESRRRR